MADKSHPTVGSDANKAFICIVGFVVRVHFRMCLIVLWHVTLNLCAVKNPSDILILPFKSLRQILLDLILGNPYWPASQYDVQLVYPCH